MEGIFQRKASKFLLLGLFLPFAVSCSDDYEYNDKEPDFLNSNIYDYLASQPNGKFSTFLKLIDDNGYKTVLSKTGSKTLFPATDEAFQRFFQQNDFNVHSYEELTPAQKRILMNCSMVNMTYLSDMLSNVPTNSEGVGGEGLALRRSTAYSYLDTIPYYNSSGTPPNSYWEARSKMYLLDDVSSAFMVHFTPKHSKTQGLTNEDISLVLNSAYEESSIYINGIKIQEKDIVCKNGYIHVPAEVITPAKNIDEIISSQSEISTFNTLMNRFSAPYYSRSASQEVAEYYNGSSAGHPLINDSIFIKRYFTETSPYDPDEKDMSKYGLLYFDPSDNSYSSMQDFGVMFVPTNKAMKEYMESSKGKYLSDAYGTWDNIPTTLAALFVKNHQKKSFINSMPHSWDTMTDESSFAMNVNPEDIELSILGSNGVVYITNKVYAPIDYQCVYASVLTSNQTKIMNWAIQDKNMKFYLYLRSMENMYNLIVPTDEALRNYRDPISWAKGKSYREIWEFAYDEERDNPIYVNVYKTDEEGNKAEKSKEITDMTIIRNRLADIVDMCIVVGNMSESGMSGYIDDGKTQYAYTKSGSMLKVSGAGESINLWGAGDLEVNALPTTLAKNELGESSLYDSDNGRTFFVNQILHDPVESVYTLLQKHDDFKLFRELLNGNERIFTLYENDPDIQSIFSLKRTSSTSGLDQVVNSFNNFQYTVFVPSNEAIEETFKEDPKLKTWDDIVEINDDEERRKSAIYLLNFLRYHFMDNAILVDGNSFSNMKYETAARDDNNKFIRMTLSSNGNQLTITDATNQSASVIKQEGVYNLLARDFIVDNRDYRNANNIVSSSKSVIHLINRALKPSR